MHLSYTVLSISLDLGVAPCPPRVSGHYRGASKRPLEACSSDKHAAQHESKCACIPQRLSAQVDLTLDSDEDCPQGTSSTGAVRVAKPSKSAVEQVCFFSFTHVCRIFLVLSVSSAPSTRHSAPTLPVLAFAKVKLQTGCVGADALETRRGGGPAARAGSPFAAAMAALTPSALTGKPVQHWKPVQPIIPLHGAICRPA